MPSVRRLLLKPNLLPNRWLEPPSRFTIASIPYAATRLSVEERFRKDPKAADLPDPVLSHEDAVDLVRPYLKDLPHERMVMLVVDARMRPNGLRMLGEGTPDMVITDQRDMVRSLAYTLSSGAILAHNHPGGTAAPSGLDVSLTTNIRLLMAAVGVRLLDHLIICGEEYYSMRANDHPAVRPIELATGMAESEREVLDLYL